MTLAINDLSKWPCRVFSPLVSTSFRENTNKAEDDAEWEREIADEVKEMKEDLREEHEKAMEKYREELEKWKKQKLDKVSILKGFISWLAAWVAIVVCQYYSYEHTTKATYAVYKEAYPKLFFISGHTVNWQIV